MENCQHIGKKKRREEQTEVGDKLSGRRLCSILPKKQQPKKLRVEAEARGD